MTTSTISRIAIAAASAVLIFASAPIRSASANEFTDLCIAGGGGLFEAQDCACLDQSLSDPAERAAVIALLRANIDAERAGTEPDETNPELKAGFETLNKYVAQCIK